jgi:PAS domain S-box-containing protein
MTSCYIMASHRHPEAEMLRLDLRKYPEIQKAIETRRPVIISDVANDPLLEGVQEVLASLDIHSIMVIPMTYGEDVLGTLCLQTSRRAHSFSEREIHFCTVVARASTNAVKNALLHRQVNEESSRHRSTGMKLAGILNQSPDLILTTDNEGRITEFNKGAESMSGHRREDVLGKPYRVLFGEEGNEGLVEKVRSAGVLSNFGCRLRREDDNERELELSMSVLRDENGAEVGTVWIGRDVTDLKAAQLQLMQAEKMSTIGQVISGVAHELNNPLSGVLGFSQLLMARHADSPAIRHLEKINESALRCQKIVQNLLSFARAHKPERKYLGVNGIIEKTLDLKKYQLHVNNIEVVADLDPELPCTMIDFHQIQQVFLNLVNNAQQAMTVVRDRHGHLEVRTRMQDGKIRVEFADNGEGMEAETLQKIFDPFFTTKGQGEGTGLGLSVSYGIIQEHGGRIYAGSRKGRGSTFVIELPVWREEGATDEQPDGEPSVHTTRPVGKRHILVVDDEPQILDLLVEVLEDSGHRVDTAANGEEARRKVMVNPYDLVISDVRMPQMNGMDLYRNILLVKPEMEGRVVFITGDAIGSETTEFLSQIDAPTLYKPLDIPEILHTVEQSLA